MLVGPCPLAPMLDVGTNMYVYQNHTFVIRNNANLMLSISSSIEKSITTKGSDLCKHHTKYS